MGQASTYISSTVETACTRYEESLPTSSSSSSSSLRGWSLVELHQAADFLPDEFVGVVRAMHRPAFLFVMNVHRDGCFRREEIRGFVAWALHVVPEHLPMELVGDCLSTATLQECWTRLTKDEVVGGAPGASRERQKAAAAKELTTWMLAALANVEEAPASASAAREVEESPVALQLFAEDDDGLDGDDENDDVGGSTAASTLAAAASTCGSPTSTSPATRGHFGLPALEVLYEVLAVAESFSISWWAFIRMLDEAQASAVESSLGMTHEEAVGALGSARAIQSCWARRSTSGGDAVSLAPHPHPSIMVMERHTLFSFLFCFFRSYLDTLQGMGVVGSSSRR